LVTRIGGGTAPLGLWGAHKEERKAFQKKKKNIERKAATWKVDILRDDLRGRSKRDQLGATRKEVTLEGIPEHTGGKRHRSTVGLDSNNPGYSKRKPKKEVISFRVIMGD